MNTSRGTRLADERGMSLIEVMIGVLVLAVALLGLLASATVALRQTNRSEKDIDLWAATQWTVDSLVSAGWANVVDGGGTVQGYPMSWTVSGTNPKQIDVVVDRKNFTMSQTVQDTVVLYLANPSP